MSRKLQPYNWENVLGATAVLCASSKMTGPPSASYFALKSYAKWPISKVVLYKQKKTARQPSSLRTQATCYYLHICVTETRLESILNTLLRKLLKYLPPWWHIEQNIILIFSSFLVKLFFSKNVCKTQKNLKILDNVL